MRIEIIEINNILSFQGKHTVDFMRKPLERAGLFAVTGRTGIELKVFLDAVCIALYGRKHESSVDGMSEIPYSDFLSPGAVMGGVRLQFSLEGGQKYEAEWSARCNKPSAPVEVNHILKQLSPGSQQWQGAEKVRQSIHALLGLTFSQFRSAVILSPGQFIHFFSVTSEERSRMLEHLTGTEIYGRMSRLVYLRRMEVRKDYEKMISLLEGISRNRFSEEEFSKLQETMIMEKGKLEKDRVALLEVEKYLSWFDRYSEAMAHQEELKLVQTDAQAAVNKLYEQKAQLDRFDQVQPFQSLYDAIVAKKKEIDVYRHSIALIQQDMRSTKSEKEASADSLQRIRESMALRQREYVDALPLIGKAYSAEGEIRAWEENINRVCLEISRLEERVTSLQSEIKDKTAEMEDRLKLRQQLKNDLQAVAMHRPMIEKIGEVKGNMAKLHDIYVDTQDCRSKLNEIQKEIQADKVLKSSLENQYNDLQSQLSSLRAELNIHIQANQGLNSAELQQRIIYFSDLQRDSRNARELWISIADSYERQDELANEIRGINADLKKLDTEVPHVSLVLFEKKKMFETAQRVLILGQHKNLLDMRKQLKEGKPCPVCGAAHHPYHAQATSDLINHLTQDFEEAKADYENSRKNYLDTLSQRQKKQLLLEERGRMLEELKARTSRMLAQWEDYKGLDASFGDTSTSVNRANRTMLLTHLLDNATRELQSEKLRNAEYNHHQVVINEINGKIQKLMTAMADVNKKLTESNAVNSVHESLVSNLERRIKHNDNRSAEMYSQLELMMTMPLWKEKYKSNYEGFVAEMSAIVSKWTDLQGQVSALDAVVYRLRTDISSLQGELDFCRGQMSDDRGIEKSLGEKIKVHRSEMAKMFSNAMVENVERSHVDHMIAVQTEESKALDKYMEVCRHYDGMSANMTMLQDMLAQAEQELHGLSSDLDFQIARFNSENAPLQYFELEKIFSAKCDWNLLRKEIDGKKAALDNINAEMEKADGQILQLIQSEDRPLEEFIGNALQYREQQKLLSADMKDIEKNIARIQFLLDKHQDSIDKLASCEEEKHRLEAELALWDRLCELMGSADGGKFRQAAQRVVFTVLLQSANAQLRRMKSSFFLSVVPDELDMEIICRDRLDQRFKVSSLSAGQLYVVCLSLALGLSAMLKEFSPGDSLFVDACADNIDAREARMLQDAVSAFQRVSRCRIGIMGSSSSLAARIYPQVTAY